GAVVYASDNAFGTVPGSDLILDYNTCQAGVSNQLLSIQQMETIPSLCLGYLPAPTLTAPSSGATGVSTSPICTWSQVTGNQGYRIIISTNSADMTTDPTSAGGTSSGAVTYLNLAANTTSYTYPYTLPAGTLYY